MKPNSHRGKSIDQQMPMATKPATIHRKPSNKRELAIPKETLQTAITLRAADTPIRTIAAETGLTRSTAHRILARDDIQQLIRQSQMDMIAGSLRTAVQNQRIKIGLSHKLLKDAGRNKDLPEHAKTLLELGDRAEGKLLESVGIHASHTQSITLNQILVDARQELSPAVEAMLARHLGDDPVDISPVQPVDKSGCSDIG